MLRGGSWFACVFCPYNVRGYNLKKLGDSNYQLKIIGGVLMIWNTIGKSSRLIEVLTKSGLLVVFMGLKYSHIQHL